MPKSMEYLHAKPILINYYYYFYFIFISLLLEGREREKNLHKVTTSEELFRLGVEHKQKAMQFTSHQNLQYLT